MPDTKQCTKCGLEKPLTEFYPHHTCRDGRAGVCQHCHKQRMQARRAKLKVAALAS